MTWRQFDKTIDAELLRHILEDLKSGDRVGVNQAGNLAVIRDGKYVGYIDFWDAKVDLLEETS